MRKQPAAISPHVEEMARLVIAEGGSTCEESVANTNKVDIKS